MKAELESMPRSARAAALVLLATAPIFGITTWQTPHTSFLAFSVPVVVCEFLLLCLAISAAGIRQPLRNLRNFTRYAAAVWLMSAFAATVLIARYPKTALYLFDTSILHAVLLLVLCHAFATCWRGCERNLMFAIATGAGCYAIIVPILVWFTPVQKEFVWASVSAGTGNYRQLGFYGLTLLALSSGLLATDPDRSRNRFLAILMILGFFLTFWSGGRAAGAAALIALFLVVAFCPGHRRARLVTLLAVLGTVGAFLSELYVPDRNMGILRIFTSASGGAGEYSSGRWEMWLKTLEAIPQSLLIGHGEGQWGRWVMQTNGLNHPHNFILQYVYQWGIFGSIPVFTITFINLFFGAARLRENLSTFLPAMACITGQLGMALFEGNLFYPYPTMIVVFCLAVLASNRTVRIDQTFNKSAV